MILFLNEVVKQVQVVSHYIVIVVIRMETGGFYLGVPRYRLHWVGIK